MNRSFLAVFISLLFSLLTLLGRADAQLAEVPTLRSRVTDLTGVLGSRVGPLREQLRLLEEEKGSQLAVLVVNSTQPETIRVFPAHTAAGGNHNELDDTVRVRP